MDPRINREVRARLSRLELPFNRDGIDPFGVSKKNLRWFMAFLGWFYRRYFWSRVYGIEHVPKRGRAMLVCNHSGGVALDAGMVIASCFFEMNPPRLAQGMAEKFINRIPFASMWTNKTGQFTGLPEHATRLLNDERLLMVFPEGARGTAKLFGQRYDLVRFGTGFMRLALETNSPIIPMAFIGGGEAIPTISNLEKVGKLIGAPYLPITPYLLPVPLPVPISVHFGEPMHFSGTGNEDDIDIAEKIAQVTDRIAELIAKARSGGGDQERMKGAK